MNLAKFNPALPATRFLGSCCEEENHLQVLARWQVLKGSAAMNNGFERARAVSDSATGPGMHLCSWRARLAAALGCRVVMLRNSCLLGIWSLGVTRGDDHRNWASRSTRRWPDCSLRADLTSVTRSQNVIILVRILRSPVSRCMPRHFPRQLFAVDSLQVLAGGQMYQRCLGIPVLRPS